MPGTSGRGLCGIYGLKRSIWKFSWTESTICYALAQHHFEHSEKHHHPLIFFLSIFQGEFLALNLVQKPIEKNA
jgi:hypothetical protein